MGPSTMKQFVRKSAYRSVEWIEQLTIQGQSLFGLRFRQLYPAEQVRVVFLVTQAMDWAKLSPIHTYMASLPTEFFCTVAVPKTPLDTGDGCPAKNLTSEGLTFTPVNRRVARELRPHIVILTNPYLPYSCHWIFTSRARLVYIPYGSSVASARDDCELQYNRRIHNESWRIIVRGPFHKGEYARYCTKGDTHVVALGHPSAEWNVWSARSKRATDERLTLGLGFHFDLDGVWSSWSRLGWSLLRYCASASDIDWVFRPHPYLLSRLPREESDEVREYISLSPNIELDEAPSCRSFYERIDALITDPSSILFDFAYTSLPMLILVGREDVPMNELAKSLIDSGHYQAHTLKEVTRFVGLMRQGRDPQRESRARFMTTNENFPEPRGTGKRVSDYLLTQVGMPHA